MIWQALADGEVTEEEQRAIDQVLTALGVSWSQLPDERDAFDQFARGRRVQAGELPVIQTSINLQKNEICHHQTHGAFLESRVARSYTSGGQKHKEEALVPTKQGDIYITSKRVLMVADGTSSIAHEKVLEVEIDQDRKLIRVVKDGRQKPLFIQVPDAIYGGILMEHLSNGS
jgi:hypothetical protein